MLDSPAVDGNGVCICGSRSARPVVMQKNGFNITRCTECGVGRAQVDYFDPADHYSEGYFTGQVEGAYLDYQGSEATLRKEFREQLQFLTSLSRRGGKLLE